MFFDNVWITILAASLLSFWGVTLIRTFSGAVLPLKEIKITRVGLAFILQFALHIFFFMNTFTEFPYITVITAILVNALIIRGLVIAKGYHCVLASTIYTLVVFSVDMVVMLTLNVFEGMGWINNAWITLLGGVILCFVVAPGVFWGLRSISKVEDEKRDVILWKVQRFLTIYAFATASLVTLFYRFLPQNSWARGIELQTFPFVMVVLGVSLLAGSDFVYSREKERLKGREVEALQRYVKDIESQSREMQKFRHDYMNVLLSMEGYVLKSENQELRDFFSNKIKKTAERLYDSGALELQNLKYIEIEEIKSILLVKLQKMISEDICVEFEAREAIKTIDIDTIIMVRIIGILLDNAIEEVRECQEKVVNVGMIKDGRDVIFYVFNSCREETVYTSNIGRKNYSTKGKDRGIGLYNLADFVTKHDNLFVETQCENGRFIQIITIAKP